MDEETDSNITSSTDEETDSNITSSTDEETDSRITLPHWQQLAVLGNAPAVFFLLDKIHFVLQFLYILVYS